MSTDGTKPPSIAPKRPAAAPARSADVQPRPASAPRSGGSAPSATQTTTSEPDTGSSTSFAERIKATAQGAVGAARNAMPSREHEEISTQSEGQRTTSPRPSASPVTSSGGPRRVRLAVAKIDPWSVMKLSFLLSVAVGIMLVVATAVVWYALDSLGVFVSVNGVITTLSGSEDFFPLLEYTAFDRAISLATMIGVVDIVLLTALSTIGAFLYNIVAALVGGVHLTLTDD